MSSTSKKDTDASSQGPSDFSKTPKSQIQESTCIDNKIAESEMARSVQFEIFDQKSHFEFGDHKLQTLLQPDQLSQFEMPNEMSFTDTQHCPSMFTINQV